MLYYNILGKVDSLLYGTLDRNDLNVVQSMKDDDEIFTPSDVEFRHVCISRPPKSSVK